MPAVLTYIPSAWPASTTLVSPVTMRDAGGPGRSRHRLDDPAEDGQLEPLFEDEAGAQRRAAGRRVMATSLTVPLTARSPMQPPGKKSGLHDVGVGRERQPPGSRRRSVAASCSSTRRSARVERRHEEVLDQFGR